MHEKLRMGMIGGGKDSFIGAVHRIAANMDGLIELTCAALSTNADKAKASGKELFLTDDNCYSSYHEMLLTESKKPKHEKIHFVSIVTPNNAHFEPAMLALNLGFHVVIEKPITLTLAEAKALQQKVEETGLLLALTHTYAGYPMVKQAKEMIANDALGKIRKIIVEYPQGWLTEKTEHTNNKQAAWRTNPEKAGISGCIADIGTHAAHLAEYISGLKISHLCADLNMVVNGRALDDDGNILLRFNNGANGVLIASQIATGEENALNIRIYGEKGSLTWHQQEPNSLVAKWINRPIEIFRTGENYLGEFAKHNTRTPSGHPEGIIEAFANIYRNFALTLNAKLNNQAPTAQMLDFPDVYDGIRGMAFITNAVKASASDKKWHEFTV